MKVHGKGEGNFQLYPVRRGGWKVGKKVLINSMWELNKLTINIR